MSPRRPRRPAQLSAEQTDFIVGTQDIALSCELAHTTAAAVVILPTTAALEADVRERITHVITTEGIDTLAETWANSPAESLPGLLWRGYLLREWIRRFPHDVNARFNAAHHYQRLHSPVDSEQGTQPHTQAPESAGSTASAASPVCTPAASPEVSAPTASAPELSAPSVSTPRTIHKLWDEVFLGAFRGDFTRVLHDSWIFMDLISHIQPEWITEDSHPLATIVTRRATALARTAEEFRYGGELLIHNRLS